MIAKQLFGRTGHQSTRAVFGGGKFGRKSLKMKPTRTLELTATLRDQPPRCCRRATGDAELRIAPLASKVSRTILFWQRRPAERTYERSQAGDSPFPSKRMGVERIDLIQLHSLADPIEWDTASEPGRCVGGFVSRHVSKVWCGFVGVTRPTASQIAGNPSAKSGALRLSISVLLPYSYIMIAKTLTMPLHSNAC